MKIAIFLPISRFISQTIQDIMAIQLQCFCVFRFSCTALVAYSINKWKTNRNSYAIEVVYGLSIGTIGDDLGMAFILVTSLLLVVYSMSGNLSTPNNSSVLLLPYLCFRSHAHVKTYKALSVGLPYIVASFPFSG